MTDIITFSPVVALDANGLPVANAKATFFESGTTTPVTVYQDEEETTPHASPLVADGNGYFPAVFRSGGAIKAIVKTPLDATLYTIDPVTKVPSLGAAAGTVSFAATAEIPETDVQAAIEHVEGIKANKADSALTGTPTAPTAAVATNTTQIATTAYVRSQILDEDDFASNSATRPPSQQSAKAYVDSSVIPSAGAIGSFAFARASTTDISYGTSVAGSDLNPTSAVYQNRTFSSGFGTFSTFDTGTALSGTWRCLGEYDAQVGFNPEIYGATLWQRIA